MVQSKQVIKKTGRIIEALPNAMFRVQLEGEDKVILCTLAGKMRLYRIRVLPGDKVSIEQTPYDETKGRIYYREK